MIEKVIDLALSKVFKIGTDIASKIAGTQFGNTFSATQAETYNENLIKTITKKIIADFLDLVILNEAELKIALNQRLVDNTSAESRPLYQACLEFIEALDKINSDTTSDQLAAEKMQKYLNKVTISIAHSLQGSILSYYEYLPNLKLKKQLEDQLIKRAVAGVFATVKKLDFFPPSKFHQELKSAVLTAVSNVLKDPSQNDKLISAATNLQDKAADQVKMYIALGADINYIDKTGITALQYAVLNSHTSAAQVLLEHGANPNLVITQGKWKGWTCLGIALFNANVHGENSLLKLLLTHGADANAQIRSEDTWRGWTPLCIAVHNWRKKLGPHVGVVKLLLEHHADPNQALSETKANEWNGWTPLCLALRNRHQHQLSEIKQIIALLINYGVNLNTLLTTADDWAGWTPLAMAVHNWKKFLPDDYTQLVQVLLAAKADPNQPLANKGYDWFGWTPLALAIWNRHNHSAAHQHACIKLLITHGADPSKSMETKDQYNAYAPLAIAGRNEEIISLLNSKASAAANATEEQKEPYSPAFFNQSNSAAHNNNEAELPQNNMGQDSSSQSTYGFCKVQ